MRAALGLLGHALVLAPIWAFSVYFRDFFPGDGPQGGEAIVALMLLYAGVLLAIATWNASRLVWVSRRNGLGSALLRGVAVVAATLLAIVLGFWLANDMSLAPTGLGQVEITLRLLMGAALFYAANLWARHVVRRETDGPSS